MKFLFKYNVVTITIGRAPMVFKIIRHHLIGYVPRAPYPITNRPEMPAPISLGKTGKLLLQSTGGPTLETFDKITQLLRRTILYMYVDMVLAYHSFKNMDILGITNLLDKVTAPDLNRSIENRIAVLGHPYYVGGQTRYRMARTPVYIAHAANIEKCVATESLALKCIVSTNE